MSIPAVSAASDAAAVDHEAARAFAAALAAHNAQRRHDDRIQEARQAAAARPRDREPRPRRLLDVKA